MSHSSNDNREKVRTMSLLKFPSFLLVGLLLSACGNEKNTDRIPINTSYDLSGAASSNDSLDTDLAQTPVPFLIPPDGPIAFTSAEAPDIDAFFTENDDENQSNSIPNTAPVVATLPNSAFESTTQFADSLVRSLLTSFNERISSGEEISAAELDCFKGYDSSLGEPLVSLRCQTPLQVVSNRLQVSEASFANTVECKNDLLIGKSDNCFTAEVSFSITNSEIQSLETAQFPIDIDTRISSFINNEISAVYIQFGTTSSATLEIQYAQLQTPGQITCVYSLASGDLLDSEQTELCNTNADYLVSEIQKITF